MATYAATATTGVEEAACDVDPATKRTVYAGVYGAVFALGLLENSVALYAFTCGRRRQATASTVFLANLAAADLLFVLTLPLRIHYNARGGEWVFGDALCRVTSYAFYVNLYGSILLLTALSVTRFISIVLPGRSLGRSRRKARAVKVSACIWVLVSVLTTPFLTMGQQQEQQQQQQDQQQQQQGGRVTCFELNPKGQSLALVMAMNYVALVVGFLLPFLTIAVCYVCILRTLLKMDKNTKASSRRVRSRSATTVLVVLAVFLLCFAPYHVQRTALLHAQPRPADTLHSLATLATLAPTTTTTPPPSSSPLPLTSPPPRPSPPSSSSSSSTSSSSSACARLRRLRVSAVASHCLAVLNCCLDPLVYFFAGDHFRRRLLLLILRARGETGAAALPASSTSFGGGFVASALAFFRPARRSRASTSGAGGDDGDYEDDAASGGAAVAAAASCSSRAPQASGGGGGWRRRGAGGGTEPGTGRGAGGGTEPGTGRGAGGGTEPETRRGAGGGTEPETRRGAGGGTEPGTGRGAGGGTEPGTGRGAGGGTEPETGRGAGGGTERGTGRGAGGGTEPETGRGTGSGPSVGAGVGCRDAVGTKGTVAVAREDYDDDVFL
ncbi:unnamed protein product [Lampetra fluviatilis]